MDLLWTIVVVLVILWLLGFSLGVVGSLIHILLVVAIIVVLVRVIQGRRPV
ncbi:MAG: lmo0937 family membrane protein [Candidatus Methanoperedens sp.]|nr:lmo0937 family membrane protein [Candidatus Methanoperedens sp.]